MNKAVLVIDMPEHCDDCNLCYYSDGRVQLCYWKDKVVDKVKPDWCPLKPVPEKYNMAAPHDRDYDMEYEYGYNACIDEILRGKYGSM